MPRRFPNDSALAHADTIACRTLLEEGSRSFSAAALLLPRRVRDPATALYAFCRLADDTIDEAHGGLGAIAELRGRLTRVYADRPIDRPADRAFARAVAKFDIPRVLPDALLEGFEWDAQGRRFESLSAVCAYAARVAGSVGAMMAILMGARDRDRLARACELGVAMQLTNIARDVGEDARSGRLYLPLEWLRDAGVDIDAFIRNPRHTPAVGAVVRRLLDTADRMYRQADAGIARLPVSCRPGIRAARALYAAIGAEVRRAGYDSVSRRASTGWGRKVLLLAGALQPLHRRASTLDLPPLEETRFLVDAVEVTVSQPAEQYG